MTLPMRENSTNGADNLSRQFAKYATSPTITAEANFLLRLANSGADSLKIIFPLVMILFFLTTAALLVASTIWALKNIADTLSLLAIYLTATVPALLAAATISHAFGNFLIAKISGITPEARRGLALHLPASTSPREWAKFFRRWIYCGDWLVESPDASAIPYARAFTTGEPPKSIEEELSLWKDLFGQIHSVAVCDSFEVGHSICEFAPLAQLPPWANEVTPGMTLPEIERALGPAGHQWAVNLLRRAALRKKSFGQIDFNGDLSEALFEFHYCQLRGDREALLVIIRPHLVRDTPVGASASDAA